ncbi:MAG: O-antigen ligase family protein, partial [Chitinophagaceae bacterium]
QITDTLGTDLPDEFLMIFTAGLFFCYWIYKPLVLSKKMIGHPLIVLLIISFAWSLLSAIFSTEFLLSFKFLLAKSWYAGAFILAPLILFREKKMISKAIMALTIAMIIVTIITMVRHYEYGYTFATINKALYPFFRNHVNYSAMLVCLIPVVCMYWYSVKPGAIKRLSFIVLLILLAALILSFARGAWLALLTGLLTVWLIKKRLLVLSYALIIIFLIGSLFWIKSNDRYLQFAHDYKTTIWHKDFGEHLTATYQFKDVSTAERFYRWIAGVRMIKDNWLTGYGPNSFYNNYRPYAIPAFKTWVSNNGEHSTVHNYFLLVTIEQGIPGLILFLLLAGAMLYYSQHLYHRINDIFYKKIAMTTGVIIIMILTVNFLSDLIETDKIGSLFFLCLSMLVVIDKKSERNLRKFK